MGAPRMLSFLALSSMNTLLRIMSTAPTRLHLYDSSSPMIQPWLPQRQWQPSGSSAGCETCVEQPGERRLHQWVPESKTPNALDKWHSITSFVLLQCILYCVPTNARSGTEAGLIIVLN